MMLTVTCYDCGEMYSLRGWIEKEDLRGTQFEEKIDTITDAELSELEEKGLIHDEKEEIEMDIINKLYTFVENGGRLEKGREPVYGEPFYHDYMYQLIKLKYEIGDRLRIESEDGTIEGIMISFCNYEITLLTSGNKVWKRKNALPIFVWVKLVTF